QPHGFDDRLEIGNPGLDRRIAWLRVREPAPPLVVPHHRVALTESAQPVAPDRALPVEVEMGQPGGDPDERWPPPVHCVCETGAIRSTAEANLLLHSLTVPP